MTTGLPEGWATIRVGDYFHSWGGMTPSTSNASYWGGKVPWVSSKDVKAWRLAGGEDFITQKALQETRLRLCPVGSVLVVVRSGILAHTLPIAVVDTPVSINQDLKAFYCPDCNLNEWLALALRALAPEILTNNRKDGTTVQSVRYEELCDLIIPVPPTAEQGRIANQVAQLIAKVRSVRERLSRVPPILKRLRQAMVAAACSGRLTEDWRAAHPVGVAPSPHNQPDASELPQSWASTRGDQLFKWSSGKFLPRTKQCDGQFLVYGGNGVAGRHSEWLVDRPTLVIGRVGALCGNVYVTEGRVWVTDNAIYAKEISPKANLRFISMVYTQADLNADAGGSGQPFVNQTTLDSVSIPLPPLIEQVEIVRRFDIFSALADDVEAQVVTGVARVNKLTQSILAKAFHGELVPSEAELAQREGREFEPAATLLDRINKQREREPKSNKRSRKLLTAK
jgi:type I restriction enzyme S subunit